METKKATQRKRKIQVKFFVTEEELERINQQMAKAEYNNKSSYLRKMALEGKIEKKDYQELKVVTREVAAIGNDINVALKQINEQKNDEEQWTKIEQRMDDIWRLLKLNLSKQL